MIDLQTSYAICYIVIIHIFDIFLTNSWYFYKILSKLWYYYMILEKLRYFYLFLLKYSDVFLAFDGNIYKRF